MTSFPKFRAPIRGITVDDSACSVDDLAQCGGVQVTAAAGEDWDQLVARAVASSWTGIEALSGVPGTVAHVVVDNAAAHGQQVADSVTSVRTWDHQRDAQKTFALVDCGFGHGTSRFQEQLPDGSPRYEILDVTFLFRQGELTPPVHDTAFARLLGIQPGERTTITRVREAVLA